MRYLGVNEVREMFLSFFESKEHIRLKSASLVPQNDKSLLLINSGMAPLKPYFTGQEKPPKKRATTCQKCIRTGDIENVGKTARHGTFFEMLGNFSFGDYFKENAIPWSWEFCLDVLEIPEDKLYVSIYLDDDEAFEIWNKTVGVPEDRIFRMGKEDNFWEVGLGPCGPCSELYFDRGEKFGCGKEGCTVGCDCDRYIEFWNLVFTQFDKQEDGSYPRLPKPNIDTGMGLERVAAMMQGVESIFDVDTVVAIRNKICEIAGVKYNEDPKNDVSIRVITDHARSMTFMTSDGVLPANDGRGYVLKRLLRRAARHGKLLGIDKPFLPEICKICIDVSKGAYPELLEKQDYILRVISMEENRFYETLNDGIEILKEHVADLKAEGKTVLGGKEAFKLYDTFGFPLDLVIEMLEDEGFTADETGFHEEMENQRTRARLARGDSSFMGAEETVFHKLELEEVTIYQGHEAIETDNVKVLALVVNGEITDTANEGDEVSVVLDKTPFYAQGGGQAGDVGEIFSDTCVVFVEDTVKVVGNRIAHLANVKSGQISVGDVVCAKIDLNNRKDTQRNHSATHLLQSALKQVLGKHVEQSGSQVNAQKLRFDFTHFQPISKEEILRVEDIVNEYILNGIQVEVSERSIQEARDMGAIAIFGEKYGETVRVVDISEASMELCGGTHVYNTSQIGSFKILTEASAAAGIRRIEAVTGRAALEHYRSLDEKLSIIAPILKATPENVVIQVKSIIQNNKELQQEISKFKMKSASLLIDNMMEEMINKAETFNNFKIVACKVEGLEPHIFRELGDRVKDKIKSGVITLVCVNEDKANMLVMATDDAVKAGINAGSVIKEAVAVLDGKGGGKPNMAMAGGKDVQKCEEALAKAKEIIKNSFK